MFILVEHEASIIKCALTPEMVNQVNMIPLESNASTKEYNENCIKSILTFVTINLKSHYISMC